MKFQHNLEKSEVIGESPYREEYDMYESTGKRMELEYSENSNIFTLNLIENIERGDKFPGETTAMLQHIMNIVQERTNKLGVDTKFQIHAVNDKIKIWCKTKAAEVVGGWDEIQSSMYTKKISPKSA